MSWVLYSIMAVSIVLNIFFLINNRRRKISGSDRDKELRVMFNNIENEIRQARNKYGLNK